MKYSNNKQYQKAKNRFEDAMTGYNTLLGVLEYTGITLTADDFNQLARQMNKLTKTLVRIKERGEYEKRGTGEK